MIMGVCGYGYTGSGAYLDLLKEFSNTSVIDDFEFDFVYLPDGIEDLYYHLCENPVRYLSGNTAIKRFINFVNVMNTPNSVYVKETNGEFYQKAVEYINSLIQVSWKGIDVYEKVNTSPFQRTIQYRILGRIVTLLEKKLNKKVEIKPYSDMYLSVKPEDFIEKSKKFLSSIMESVNADMSKIVVLNQPLVADDPRRYFKYYDAPSAVIINKDPRDMYILAKEVLHGNGSFIPTNNVVDFVYYYKKVHEYHSVGTESVYNFNFESLIYEYDKTILQIKDIFNIGEHINKNKYFNPQISINNTQLFKRYPKYSHDVGIIEKELKEWLYPFEKYGNIQFTKDAF